MKKQKRVKLKYGSARVDEDCPKDVVDALEKLAETAYQKTEKTEPQRIACYACQGGGCPVCDGVGTLNHIY